MIDFKLSDIQMKSKSSVYRSVLWTGATGFFGKSMLRCRKNNTDTGKTCNEDLHLLSRNPLAFLAQHQYLGVGEGITWHQGDILGDLPNPPLDLTHVVHAATDSTIGPTLGPSTRFHQIVEGTRRILEWSARAGVKRILLTSSGGVYGPQPQGLDEVREDYHGMPDPLIAENAYSVGKRAAEHLCALASDQFGIEIVIARCFAFVGQDLPLNAHFAIGNFVRDALWGSEIIIQGDGLAVRSYLDQRDLVAWLQALLARGSAGAAYNVGGTSALTLKDLAYLVRDILSPGKPVKVLGQKSACRQRDVYVPSTEKIKTELGLTPQFSLEQSIKDMGDGVLSTFRGRGG